MITSGTPRSRIRPLHKLKQSSLRELPVCSPPHETDSLADRIGLTFKGSDRNRRASVDIGEVREAVANTKVRNLVDIILLFLTTIDSSFAYLSLFVVLVLISP